MWAPAEVGNKLNNTRDLFVESDKNDLHTDVSEEHDWRVGNTINKRDPFFDTAKNYLRTNVSEEECVS